MDTQLCGRFGNTGPAGAPKTDHHWRQFEFGPHPVQQIAEIAKGIGAKTPFDAAHQCGIIAGRAWDNPLSQGADIMTMSTYKSLAVHPLA